jgi:hypothetical protein
MQDMFGLAILFELSQKERSRRRQPDCDCAAGGRSALHRLFRLFSGRRAALQANGSCHPVTAK